MHQESVLALASIYPSFQEVGTAQYEVRVLLTVAHTIPSKTSVGVEDGRLVQRSALIIGELVLIGVGAGAVEFLLQKQFVRSDKIPMPRKELSNVTNVVALVDVGVVKFIPEVFSAWNSHLGWLAHDAEFGIDEC